MENWFRIFLLSSLSALSLQSAWAEEKTATTESATPDEVVQTEPIIQPDVARREVKEDDIDTENYEVGAFIGLLSIEDFGTEIIIGARLVYHVTEDFFFEGSIAQTEAGTTSFERLSGGVTLLTDDQRTYSYYSVAIGYNVLPGEAFIGRESAYNTALYLIAGVGNTTFAGDNRFTVSIGGGYRLIATDWLAVHLDVRDHIYSIDVTGQDKATHNMELSVGFTYFF